MFVEFEYLISSNSDKEEKSKGFEYEKTLAFFIVNLGFTRKEFDELTRKEMLFILKAWENKIVMQSQLQANAFYNAYCNANRKKNTSPIPLWEKKNKKQVNIYKKGTRYLRTCSLVCYILFFCFFFITYSKIAA